MPLQPFKRTSQLDSQDTAAATTNKVEVGKGEAKTEAGAEGDGAKREADAEGDGAAGSGRGATPPLTPGGGRKKKVHPE